MTRNQRKQPNILVRILAVGIMAIIGVVTFAALPLTALLLGMFVGQVLAWLTGDYVVQALNALGLVGVGNGDLPKVFGLIAVLISLGISVIVAFTVMIGVSTNGKKKGSEVDDEVID